MRGRPPHFRGEAIAEIAQRFDRSREQERLADGNDLRFETLLARLDQKVLRVRRNHDARHDLRTALLERCDLCGEVLRHGLKTARVLERKTLLREHRRKAELAVAPRVAVAVVRKESTDRLVGLYRLPHTGVDGDHVFKAPEEVIREAKTFLRITLPAEEPRLPRHYGGDARHLVDLA